MALVVTFVPLLRSGANVTTRTTNKQYALQKSCYYLVRIMIIIIIIFIIIFIIIIIINIIINIIIII